MSKPGIIYRMQWDTTPVDTAHVNVPAQTVTVNIYDTETLIADDADEEIRTLTPAMTPLTLSVINNDENKLSPIKAKQAVVRFQTNTPQSQDMAAFTDSSDNRWKVEILVDTDIIFLGFLMLSDVQQPFLPDPQTVELTASDHLGILKDIPLVTLTDEAPVGKYRIAELIAMCLRKTGLSLNINVINNLRHGSGTFSIPMAFVGSTDNIAVANDQYYRFYAGQEITITGSASNDGTYKILDTGTGIVSFLHVDGDLTDEAEVTVTVTDNSTGHFYDKIYVDALTYEASIREMQDCYEVLSKILGEDCFLTQWRGQWWIFRIDEIDENPFYQFVFDADGVLQSNTTIDLGREAGYDKTIMHANASTLLRSERPHKFVKLTYRYQNPSELFCNIDYSRGDVITPADLSAADGTGTYVLDCWTVRRIGGSITSTAFITRKFIYGTESERYITITPAGSTATPWDFAQSQAIEMAKNDKVAVTVNFKYDTDFNEGGVTVNPLRVRLHGDDGNHYYWWHPTSNDLNDYYWTVSPTEAERPIAVQWDSDNTDERLWQTLSVEMDPLPVSGKLYIELLQGRQVTTGGTNQNINYQGISVEHSPYINGSYRLFKGHYNKVTRATNAENYNAKREKDVFLGDSPRKTFKGAMFWLDSNGIYNLTTSFYASNVFALGPPSTGSNHPYGYIQAFSVWNQYLNASRIFPSTLYGLFTESTTAWPDILHKYSLTDVNSNTNNRYFMAVSFEQDWKTCLWKGTFIETYRRDIGHQYGDDHDFVFLTE